MAPSSLRRLVSLEISMNSLAAFCSSGLHSSARGMNSPSSKQVKVSEMLNMWVLRASTVLSRLPTQSCIMLLCFGLFRSMARSRSQTVKPSALARRSCMGKSSGLVGAKSVITEFSAAKRAASTSSLYKM